MSQRDEARGPSDRLYWLWSPVCLEWPEETREEAHQLHLLAGLARKTGRALARVLGLGPC